MRSYSCYFVKTQDAAKLRTKLGPIDSRSVEPVEGSEWIAWGYYPGDGPPDDDLLEGRDSTADQQSLRMDCEVIFIYADTSQDFLVYEHAKDGVLLRKLVWAPMSSDDWAHAWICVSGEPESWEKKLTDVDGSERLIEAGKSLPEADGTVAFLIEAHWGLKRPARG